MKRNKALFRSIIVVIGILFTLTAASVFAADENLVGAVIKTDQGTALSTDSGEYLLLGKDLSGMVGETVSVTGTVDEGALANTIKVTSVKVLNDKDVIDPSSSKTSTAAD